MKKKFLFFVFAFLFIFNLQAKAEMTDASYQLYRNVYKSYTLDKGKTDRFNYMTWGLYYKVYLKGINNDPQYEGSIYKGWIVPHSYRWIKHGKDLAYARNNLVALTDTINVYNSHKYSDKTKFLGQIYQDFFTEEIRYSFYDKDMKFVAYVWEEKGSRSLRIYDLENDDLLLGSVTVSDKMNNEHPEKIDVVLYKALEHFQTIEEETVFMLALYFAESLSHK